MRVAAGSSRLASREARKSLLFTLVRGSSGESRSKEAQSFQNCANRSGAKAVYRHSSEGLGKPLLPVILRASSLVQGGVP